MQYVKNKVYNTLKLSEKFFRTDMIYLAKGGFWLSFGQAGASLLSFLLAIAFAHFLSQNEYGIYKYIMSLASIAWALSLSGIGTSIIQSVAQGLEGSLKDGFKESLKWSIFTVLSSLAIGIYYFTKGNLTLFYALIIVALFSPLLNSSALYISYLTGKQNFKKSTLYWLYVNIFSTITLLITVIFTQKALVLVFAYFISNTIGNTFFYLYTLKKYQPNNNTEPHTLSYGKHLSAMNIIDAIAQQIDKILIFQLLGSAPLAIYSFALALPEQIRGLLKGIARLALPKFSTQSIKDLQKNIPKKSITFSLGVILIIIVYIIAAPFLYKFIFPQYIDAVKYSQVLSITMLGIITTLPQTALQAKRHTKELYIGNMSSNIFQIIANIVLISQYGLWGIVMARIVSKAFNIIIFFILLRNSKSIHPEEVSAS